MVILATVPQGVDLNGNDFILANLEVSGFYRVNYDESNWEKLISQLLNYKEVNETFHSNFKYLLNSYFKAIPVRSRAQLINDAFVLSQSSESDTIRPFEIIKYLSKETEYLPWSTTLIRLGYITDMLDSTSAYGNYEKYAIGLILPIYNKLGWIESSAETWLER